MIRHPETRSKARRFASISLLTAAASTSAFAGRSLLPTTLDDFFQPGSQPEPNAELFEPVDHSINCAFCHADYLFPPTLEEPHSAWRNTMMAQAVRDPVWFAAMAIANQDASTSGEFCIRCHSPGGWLAGRSLPPDGSALISSLSTSDYDGVTCHFCHRQVSPVLMKDSPVEDVDILAALEFPPGDLRGNGRYVVDPADVRRGPFLDIAENPDMNLHGVPVIWSPYHTTGEICSMCHDLGNPNFTRQPDDTYALNELGEPHPTQDVADMFPEHTTYSEWKYSQFANGGVFFPDGRFGGYHIENPEFIKAGTAGLMQTCQDCHQPDQFTGGCFAWEMDPWYPRPDMPVHAFAGANTWVLKAVRALYSDAESGLSDDGIATALERTLDMLRSASDMQVVQLGDTIKVRIINFSGHKLPTGYPEGRRMWINVQFFDDEELLIAEHGHYDFVDAELTDDDTKVYEKVGGISEEVSKATGLPVGESHHLTLNSVLLKDNRIPPIGFTNEAFHAFGGMPVEATYADGQYWDDTEFMIPAGAVHAVVTLYHQSMTKEYIAFLRDENMTDDTGDTVYGLWEDPAVGNKVPPVDMDTIEIDLEPEAPLGDINGDGSVGFSDLLLLLDAWGDCPPPDICPADLDCNGTIGFADLLLLLDNWS